MEYQNHRVKIPAAKLTDLSSTSRTHVVKGREVTPASCSLASAHTLTKN